MNVHFSDIKMLEKTLLEVYHDFSKYELFFISETKNYFSAMKINQRHEKNKNLKGEELLE